MRGNYRVVSRVVLRNTLKPRARTAVPRAESHLEAALLEQIKIAGLPEPEREVRFSQPRRWRFDLAWPAKMIAVECEGGTWARGRHTRGAGFEKDCEKSNAAQLLGWRLFRFTKAMIDSGDAIVILQAVMK